MSHARGYVREPLGAWTRLQWLWIGPTFVTRLTADISTTQSSYML